MVTSQKARGTENDTLVLNACLPAGSPFQYANTKMYCSVDANDFNLVTILLLQRKKLWHTIIY